MPGRRRKTGPEAGMTLVELLVTISITGIAFAVIVGGLFTSIVGSDANRRRASTETLLRSAAESVKGAGYQDCAEPADYPVAAGVTVVNVTYWHQATNRFDPSCPSPDSGLQLIRLRVEPGRGLPPETLDVVKRVDS